MQFKLDENIASSLFIVLMLAAFSFFMLRILSPFIESLFWAAVLAFAFYPTYDFFRRLFPTLLSF